jgi:signal transduction histidine kinase/ActR/RegA family two-component response regulator
MGLELNLDSRILIYAPIGKDARLIAEVFKRAGVKGFICQRAGEVTEELRKGAGAILLVDEALTALLLKPLIRFLQDQPTWSDLPILMMSQRGFDSSEIRQIYLQLGNVTLLERPVQSVTLISAATSALRARQRQYAMCEVDRRKDEFLAMLAHELRNPLAPVSAASDLLKMPNLDREKIRQTSEIISRQVKHMTGLIDDLLDVSRVSRGLVALEASILDAMQVVVSAVEQVRPLIDERKQHLNVMTTSESVSIKGDQKRLVQVLSNVLNNAAKYTPEGGEISLSLDVTEHEVIYTVTDDGIGIAPNVINHIFEMFAQAERTPDRTQGGLGIGLALVKNIVQLHGGTVSAESDGPGRGSRFQITFPRSYDAQETTQTPSTKSEVKASDRTVLVVDDNVDAAKMLGMFLELVGYQVKVVHSAGEALAVAEQSQQIAACLLDIGLPDMDGNDLAKKLRTIAATSTSMLIAITGYGQAGDRCNTQNAGFDHHRVKPVDMEELVAILSTLH